MKILLIGLSLLMSSAALAANTLSPEQRAEHSEILNQIPVTPEHQGVMMFEYSEANYAVTAVDPVPVYKEAPAPATAATGNMTADQFREYQAAVSGRN